MNEFVSFFGLLDLFLSRNYFLQLKHIQQSSFQAVGNVSISTSSRRCKWLPKHVQPVNRAGVHVRWLIPDAVAPHALILRLLIQHRRSCSWLWYFMNTHSQPVIHAVTNLFARCTGIECLSKFLTHFAWFHQREGDGLRRHSSRARSLLCLRAKVKKNSSQTIVCFTEAERQRDSVKKNWPG